MTSDPQTFRNDAPQKGAVDPPRELPGYRESPQDGVAVALSREDLDRIFTLAHEQLYALASTVMRGKRLASISPTSLVQEAWLKLAKSPSLASVSALHFRRIAACAMRQVLADAARNRNAQSRGGDILHVTWVDFADPCARRRTSKVLDMEKALSELREVAPRATDLVEAHFYGGLDWTECAELFQISEATVMREWRFARAWLNQFLER